MNRTHLALFVQYSGVCEYHSVSSIKYFKKCSFTFTEWPKFSLMVSSFKKTPKIWDLTAQSQFRNIILPKPWHWLPGEFQQKGKMWKVPDPSNNHNLLRHLLGNLSPLLRTVIERKCSLEIWHFQCCL